MRKPRLLDLFCGAGGASVGYARAGFEVVGVDIAPQNHYPFEFHRADAMTYPLEGFDAIHASPPCQAYTRSRHIRHPGGPKEYPRLIAAMLARLADRSEPWVLENVADASTELRDAILLCGTSFGLRVQRHRLFQSNVMLFSHGVCRHRTGDISVRRKHADYCGVWTGVTYQDYKGRTRKRPQTARHAEASAAMGINWMTQTELGESIPPAYTEWLGRQLFDVVINQMEAVA